MTASLSPVLRSLRRTPGFAATVVCTLALGIGLATAVFTVADTLLVRRLPVSDQNRIVVLQGETAGGAFPNFPLPLHEIRDFAAGSRALGAVAAFGFGGASPVAVRDGDRVLRLREALVTGDFFDVLGARPMLGRALRPADDLAGAAPLAVLSHRAWIDRFGGDPNVVGRPITLDATGRALRIAGVMPRGLDWPRGTDFWAPVVATTTGQPDSLNLGVLDLIGRLRPGASPRSAAAELTTFLGRAGAPALERDVHGVARTLPDLLLGDARSAALAISAAAALLLLLTCLNVANLLLVRGLARLRELALRTALGASRGRLTGRLLAESAVLAAGGAVLGAALAAGALRAFVAIAPPGTPRLDELTVDARVLWTAIGVTALATLLFAVAPALVTSHVDPQTVLRSGAGHVTGGRRLRLAREALVAAQVALAVVVLAGAGLLVRSFVSLTHVDLAFAPRGLVVAGLSLRGEVAGDAGAQRALIERLLPRVSALPQVDAVTPVLTAPFDAAGGIFGRLAGRGQTPEQVAGNPMLDLQVVAPGYFRTLGITVTRGRGFTDADADGAPLVVVVSAALARHYWPGADPLGRQLQWGTKPGQQVTVVGVAADPRWRDLRDVRPTVWFPLRQSMFPVAPATLVIRASRSPAGLTSALRRVLADFDAGVELTSATPFASLMEEPLAQPRLDAMLLSLFAVAAVALAGIGLFGALAATVRHRTRELGIRMALGATRGRVGWLVTRRGLTVAAIGAGAGVMGARVAGGVIATLLYGVRPADPVTLGLATIGILGVAAVACIVPARAGTRIDPAIALRSED